MPRHVTPVKAVEVMTTRTRQLSVSTVCLALTHQKLQWSARR
eukprot:COSAG06_NODE_49681_length_323_cov_1.589286_1_plen_41_part_01